MTAKKMITETGKPSAAVTGVKTSDTEKIRQVKGYLFKRGNVFWLRTQINGSRKSFSLQTADRKEAEKKRKEFLSPFTLGNKVATRAVMLAELDATKEELAAAAGRAALSFEDAWTAFEKSPFALKNGGRQTLDGGKKQMTIYRGEFNALSRWCDQNGIKTIQAIDADTAARFLADGLNGKSAATFNRYLTLFRHLWDILADTATLTNGNPWRDRRIMKAQSETPARRALTLDELMAVCAPLKGEMRILFAIGLYTGMRLGDAVNLGWDAIRSDANGKPITVAFTPHKTSRHNSNINTIPLNDELSNILSETPLGKRDGYILPTFKKTYDRDKAALIKQIQRVFKAAGIATTAATAGRSRRVVVVGFHSLRHSFVSLSANAGIPLSTVQAMVGHTTPQMTLHYTHISETAKARAISNLPSLTMGGDKENATKTDPQLMTDKAKKAIKQLATMTNAELQAIINAANSELGKRERN